MLELAEAGSDNPLERNDQVLAIQIAAQAVSNFPTEGEGLVPISLDVDEAANDAMLQTNEQGATRVLVLLLDNARRYTKEGHIRLLVGKKDGVVRFTVEDTGIGVPPNEAEHIFQEFVQLNEYEEGTGIGLTVARSIARRLGGDVVLDTSYTGGARFVMTHPVLQA
jgi:signal transduction histidine kinase